jgi:hypothetical protein
MDQGGPKSRFLGLSPDPCLDTCYANSFRGKVRMGTFRLSVSDSQDEATWFLTPPHKVLA